MTDKEVMQMALDALETITSNTEKMNYYCSFAVEIEALRTALAQPENKFNPDWDAMAVMVEEQQRMAKRIEELTQLVTSQGIRLMDAEKEWVGLTDEERNDCLVEADPCEALAEPEARQLMEEVEARLKEKNG